MTSRTLGKSYILLEYAVFIANTNLMTFSRPTTWETKTPEEIVEDLKLVRTMAMYEGDELVKRLEANELMVIDEPSYKKPYSHKEKKSKGEKKRQRSEWNSQMGKYPKSPRSRN